MKLYNKLFITKEFRSIVGKGWQNFWILFAIFLFTIFALEFSRSGLKYLSYKMSDPFINWIEVKEQAHFECFMEDVNLQKDSFNISTIEANNYILEYVFNRDYKKILVEGRTISYDSRLLEKILDGENAVVVRDFEIQQNDYGWIITKDLMSRLGYEDENNYPLFINYTFPGDTANIKRFGLTDYNEYIAVPIPITAVVNQLPDLLDFITPSHFMEQNTDGSKPFNISMHEEYFRELILVAEKADEDFETRLRSHLNNSGIEYDENFEQSDYNRVLRVATKYRIIMRDSAYQKLNAVAHEICNDSALVYRVYEYAFEDGYKLRANYLSFMFADLSQVSKFANWSKENHGIRIDMTQIEAKNNFNTFNILASLLCFFISGIVIVFVVIFLYFLIDAHFHRIAKNLGTIMAFGLSNKTIIGIYLMVFLGLIATSLFTVIAILYGIESLCSFMHWTREGGLPYFSLADSLVCMVIVLLPIISAIVIIVFLRLKLKATPGDLIFERNN
ncbi:MAG: hypothetical protein LBG80_13820 [Bacteroidales bacterium]|jgi:hypothetical protein|nr:hypothetical protein [Bacteroidales bacterium]